MTGQSKATPRRDSVRNRALLIEAAKAAFAADGFGASVNRIADDAGVNVATLYRHFPTKEQLIEAVLGTLVEPLATARDEAIAGPQPLATFLARASSFGHDHRGLVDALAQEPAVGASARTALRRLALEVVEPLADVAHASGELREDYDATDLLVALGMITKTAQSPAVEERGIERYAQLVLRGLARSRATS